MILRALSVFSIHASQVADHLWQSTLFVILAAILALALRKNQGRVRYWVWLTASMKFLIPFSLLIALGSHLAKPRVRTPAQTVVYSAVEDFSQPFAGPELPLISPAAPPPVSRFHLLPPIIVAAWLAGMVVVLLVWSAGWIRVSRMVARAVPLEEGPEFEALRRLESSLGIRTPIRLVLSRNCMEPGIFGVFRPVLIWPEGVSQHLDDRHINAILTHEISHARRHDNLTAILHMLVEDIFWFHPLVWWIGGRLEEERERACDEEVSLVCNQPHVYAESILRVCKFCSESPLACVSGITGADLKRRIAAIVTGRALLRMSWPKKLLLAASAVCVVTAPVLEGMNRPASVSNFSSDQADSDRIAGKDHAAPPEKLPAWDVISVKQSDAQKCQGMGMGKTADAVDISCVPLLFLIQETYGIPDANRIAGAPEWAKDSLRYDIHAKVAGEDAAVFDKLGQQEMKRMLQSLLIDRFYLKTHLEKRDMPVYKLVIAKSGPKLKQATAQESASEARLSGGRGKLEAIGAQLSSLPMLLSNEAGRPVVDKTGLTGKYDFTLEYVPASHAATDETGGPSIFTALEQQLGLKLEPVKAPMDVLVIDHAEKPNLDGAETPAQNPPGTEKGGTAAIAPAIGPKNAEGLKLRALEERDRKPTFEVASVRLAQDRNGPRNILSYSPDGISIRGCTLAFIIAEAYKFPVVRLQGTESLTKESLWTPLREGYDITAKADHPVSREQIRLMLQSLLQERLDLRTHLETRTGPIYKLVVSKSGARLEESGAGEFSFSVTTEGMAFRNSTMALLSSVLSGRLDRPVIDQTGLTKLYSFILKSSDETTEGPIEKKAEGISPDSPSAAVFDESLKRLGLQLVKGSGPIDYLVVDQVAASPATN
jgi:bla regulator protein blaR1